MATQLTRHTNDPLPNHFPPPRPTTRHYDVLSNYSKGHVMTQSIPGILTRVEGGTALPEDDDIEPLPMYKRITPVLYDRPEIGSLIDPELCITPEKPTSSIRRSRLAQSTSPGSDCTYDDETSRSDCTYDEETLPPPSRSQKVRFDQNVTVKHLSPDETEIVQTSDTSREAQFHDDQPFEDSFIGTDGSYEQEATDGSHIQPVITQTNGFMIQPSTDNSLKVVNNENWPNMRRKVSNRSPINPLSDRDFVLDSEIIDVKPSKMVSSKTLLMESGTTEHVLARPEFNSTLYMSKEVQEMAKQTIDLTLAVAEQLKSEKIKTRVDEKTYSVLNQARQQFPNLISVDVREDDVVETAAQQIAAKAKPTHSNKHSRPEERLARPPDLMEFYTPDLQREVPNLSLPYLTAPPMGPSVADALSAFDTYNHTTAWEEW